MSKYYNVSLGICLVIGICVLGFSTIVGCGQANNPTTTTTTGTTTTTSAGGLVSIAGTLNTGTVHQSSIRAKSGAKILSTAYAAQSDYSVVAVAKSTGSIYFPDSKTSTTGAFTISNLPSGESYYLEILDSSNKLVASVAFGTSGSSAVMAITPEAQTSINLGQVNYDSTKAAAAPSTEPTAYLDTSSDTKVAPATGETLVPKGAGNFGKGSATQMSGYTSTKIDGDKDGLPNYFDADNNGDLIPDEFDGLYSMEALTATPLNFFDYAFTNLKVDHDQRTTFKTDYATFSIAIGVTANAKGGSTKTISSVKVVDGPNWMSKAKDISGALWSASNYAVPLTQTGIYEVQLGSSSIKPLTDVNAGDTLKFRVTYTDGTTEESIKMINFVFTDIPRALAYKVGNEANWHTVTDAQGPIATATTSEVTIRWSRPSDEAGAPINSGRYTWEYNNSSGGASEVEVIALDPGTGTSLEATKNMINLPDFQIVSNRFLVGVCIRSKANDNSAENVYFTKGW